MNVYECNGKNVVTDEMLGFGMNISSVTDEIILTIAQSKTLICSVKHLNKSSSSNWLICKLVITPMFLLL